MFEILAFDLAALDDAARALDDGVRAVERQLAELRAYLAPLRASWSGPAAEAFDAHQRQWDRAATDLAASLAQLHDVVQVAHHNYGAAVAADQRMWSL